MRDVFVVGEALVDLYCVADGRPRRMDEPGVLERHLGGAPANFSVGCARLGLSVALATRVGADPMGRLLLRWLRDERVDTSGVRAAAGHKTGLSLVSVSEAGERSFDFYGAPSADMLVHPDDLGAALDARILHFGSNTLIVDPGLGATRRAVEMARREGAIVSCDLNVRRYRWSDEAAMRAQLGWACDHADWLKVSDDELPFVVGHTDPDRAAVELLARGPKIVAVTLGPDGALLYMSGRREHHNTLATQIVDTTGAGDAFWAGCVAALTKSDDLQAALHLGSQTAAACIARVGAT
jgi:fructokinase